MPFGVLPMHAQMAQRAGFDSFHISGASASTWLLGSADVGIMTRTEVIANARRVVLAVDIPVYCDADTGYGGIQNVQRTIAEFINAGVAGVHIEDQLDPKKAGGQAGISLVSDEEAIGRLRVAVAARDALDPDFVITARTDGYGADGGGLEEAVRRGKLYKEEAAVDVIFYEGFRSWDEARYALAETPGPAYVIPSRHAAPTPTVAELSEMGQAINIVPFTYPAVQESWRLLLAVRRTGELEVLDNYVARLYELEGSEEFVGRGEAFVRPSYADIRELERLNLPRESQRNYETTIHDADERQG